MGKIFMTFIVVVLGFWFLASCLNNPFGVTDRTSIQYQAEQNIAQINATAQIDIAAWEAKAKIRAAEENTKAVANRAKHRRVTHQIWAGTLPLLALIAVSGVVLALVVMYRGKALVLFAQKGMTIPLFPELHRPHPPPQTPNRETTLAEFARQRNQHVRKENGYYLLVDNTTNQVVRQLAPRE